MHVILDKDINKIVSSINRLNTALCNLQVNQDDIIQDTIGEPTWDPSNPDEDQATFAFDPATATFYYWNGAVWTGIILASPTTQQTENINWRFDTSTTAADPGSGEFRLNNIFASLTTNIYFNDLTTGGFDISNVFATIEGEWLLYFQDTDDATKFAAFSFDAANLVDNTGWWTMPVTFLQAGATLPGNNQRSSFLLISKNVSGLGSFTKAQLDTAVSDGNVLFVGDITQYTDELAQDAIGAMTTDGSLVYVDATPLLTRGALTGEVTAAQGSNSTVVDKTAISNRSTVTADPADFVLISDSSDSNNLKKALASDFGGAFNYSQVLFTQVFS